VNNLMLGVTIALRDAFTSRARLVERQMRSLHGTTASASRAVARHLFDVESAMWSATRTFAVGVGLMAATLWPVKKAAEFGTQIARVATIADYASTNVGQLSDEILKLAHRFPQDANNIAQATYKTISSGFLQTEAALRIVTEGTALAVATLTDAKTATNGLTSVLLAYGQTSQSAEHYSNMMFETVRVGKITMDQLSHSIGMVAGIAAAAKIPVEELFGTVATMTLAGLTPEQAMQYSRQVFMGIVRPTRMAATAAKEYGIEWNAAKLARDGFNKTLFDAWEKTGAKGNIEGFSKLLSGRQALAGALAIVNQMDKLANSTKRISEYMVEDQFGVLTSSRLRAEKIMAKELEYQLDRLKSAWGSLMIIMGTSGKSMLTPVVSALAAITGYTRQLIQLFPFLGQVLWSLVAAGTAVAFMFGIRQVRAVWGSVAALAGLSGASITLLGVQYSLLAATVLLAKAFLVIALAAAVIRKAWQENWGGLNDKVRTFMYYVRATTIALGNMKGEWGAIPEEMAQKMEQLGIYNTWVRLFMLMGRIKAGFYGFMHGIHAAFMAWVAFARESARWAADMLGRLPLVGGLVRWLASLVEDVLTAILKMNMEGWYKTAWYIGVIVASMGAAYTAMKLWGGAVLLFKAAWAGIALLIAHPIVLLLALSTLLAFIGASQWDGMRNGARIALYEIGVMINDWLIRPLNAVGKLMGWEQIENVKWGTGGGKNATQSKGFAGFNWDVIFASLKMPGLPSFETPPIPTPLGADEDLLDEDTLTGAVTNGVVKGMEKANQRFHAPDFLAGRWWENMSDPYDDYYTNRAGALAERQQLIGVDHGDTDSLAADGAALSAVVDLLKLLVSKQDQGRHVSLSVDGREIAAAVERPMGIRQQQALERSPSYVAG
jgi:TP901 family phage tail tape measure protein